MKLKKQERRKPAASIAADELVKTLGGPNKKFLITFFWALELTFWCTPCPASGFWRPFLVKTFSLNYPLVRRQVILIQFFWNSTIIEGMSKIGGPPMIDQQLLRAHLNIGPGPNYCGGPSQHWGPGHPGPMEVGAYGRKRNLLTSFVTSN